MDSRTSELIRLFFILVSLPRLELLYIFLMFVFVQILQESGVLESAFFYDQYGNLIESFLDQQVTFMPMIEFWCYLYSTIGDIFDIIFFSSGVYITGPWEPSRDGSGSSPVSGCVALFFCQGLNEVNLDPSCHTVLFCRGKNR